MVKPIDPRKHSHTTHQWLKVAQLHCSRLIASIRMHQPICVQLSAKTRLRAAICSRNPRGVALTGAFSLLIDEQAYLVMITGGSVDPMGMAMREFI